MSGTKFPSRAWTWLLAIAVASCSLFDFTVNLTPQTFKLDFGQQTGSMPTVACNMSAGACNGAASFNFDTTGTTPGAPSQVGVTLGCDDASRQCYAQVTARAQTTVGVIQDNSFSSKVERSAVSFVKLADIAYTIPTNTLTFDIPKIDIYAGPAGSALETDPGVALLGSTQPITAGMTTTQSQHLIVTDNSPARPVIEHAVENKQDFVFIVVASPRMNAGNPVPAGSIEIDVAPSLTVGL
jgi:hypothetical protein